MREYTVREYDEADYDEQRKKINNMSNKKLAENIEGIARGWLPDYNFSGDERDFDNHKLHMIMTVAAERLTKE